MSDLFFKTTEVRSMYEEQPYPSPTAGDMVIRDLNNAIEFLHPVDNLRHCRVLDAGCGTGHRLIALAQTFPETDFTGIDMTAASLEIATNLANRHQVTNVRFVQHNLLEPLSEQYDLIVSTGVVNCLENAGLGIYNFCQALTDKGILLLWLYHRYGEFSRLLDRELALMFCRYLGQAGWREKTGLLRRLGLSLPIDQYGTTTASQRAEASRDSIDVDAYLHPIVNTYTFTEAIELISGFNIDWIAPNGINWRGQSKLIDLKQSSGDEFFTLMINDVFPDQKVQDLFHRLPLKEQLEAVELAIKPTGLTLLAGKNSSYDLVDERVRNNLVWQSSDRRSGKATSTISAPIGMGRKSPSA